MCCDKIDLHDIVYIVWFLQREVYGTMHVGCLAIWTQKTGP